MARQNISPLFEDDFTTEQANAKTQNNFLLGGFNSDLNKILNPDSIPGADPSTGSSKVAQSLAPTPISESPGLFNKNVLAEANRTKGDSLSNTPTTQPGQQGLALSSLAPISAGISAGNQFQPGTSGDASEAIAGVGLSTASGAISGALSGAAIGAAGGPIGAGVGAAIGAVSALVISGTKAWFGVRSARKKKRALKELQRKAEKQRLENIARDEKWRRINQFNTTQAAADNRQQIELQRKWEIYGKVSQQMTSLINSDATLNKQMKNQMRGA
jgi:hypothetical protein